jgi:hypothetical protein
MSLNKSLENNVHYAGLLLVAGWVGFTLNMILFLAVE